MRVQITNVKQGCLWIESHAEKVVQDKLARWKWRWKRRRRGGGRGGQLVEEEEEKEEAEEEEVAGTRSDKISQPSPGRWGKNLLVYFFLT